jgi:phage I-like protein
MVMTPQVLRERIARLAEHDDPELLAALDALLYRCAQAEAKVADLSAQQIEASLEDARQRGLIRSTRDADGELVESPVERRLRRIGECEGLEVLRAELAAMQPVIPLRTRLVHDTDPQPPRIGIGGLDVQYGAALSDVARQMGLDPRDVASHAAAIEIERAGGRR